MSHQLRLHMPAVRILHLPTPQSQAETELVRVPTKEGRRDPKARPLPLPQGRTESRRRSDGHRTPKTSKRKTSTEGKPSTPTARESKPRRLAKRRSKGTPLLPRPSRRPRTAEKEKLLWKGIRFRRPHPKISPLTAHYRTREVPSRLRRTGCERYYHGS